MRIHLHCAAAGLVGLLLGAAAVAYGQEPGHAAAAAAGDGTGLLEAAKVLGLPGVLAGLGTGLGWLLRGGGIPVTATVQLHPDDRDLLRRAVRHLAAAVDSDGPPTNPGYRPPKPLDGSEL